MMYNMTIFDKKIFFASGQNRSVWFSPGKKGFPQKTAQQHIRSLFQRPYQLIEIKKLDVTLKVRLEKKIDIWIPDFYKRNVFRKLKTSLEVFF